MSTRKHTKLVYEGDYVAKVEIEIMDAGDGWSPYISLEDALKLDDVREALRRDDLDSANKLARVYRLLPVKAA